MVPHVFALLAVPAEGSPRYSLEAFFADRLFTALADAVIALVNAEERLVNVTNGLPVHVDGGDGEVEVSGTLDVINGIGETFDGNLLPLRCSLQQLLPLGQEHRSKLLGVEVH